MTELPPQQLTQGRQGGAEQAQGNRRARRKHINYTSVWVPWVNMQLMWKCLVTSRKGYSSSGLGPPWYYILGVTPEDEDEAVAGRRCCPLKGFLYE